MSADIAVRSLARLPSSASDETQARVRMVPPLHCAGLGCTRGPGVLPSLAPVAGRCSGYSSSCIWQGSGRILDTIPDSSTEDLQEVVDF